MTKFAFSFLSLLLAFQFVIAKESSATTVQCLGDVLFDGAFVDLSCRNGNCSGWIPALPIQINGKCDLGMDYEAYATVPSSFVSGACKDGLLSSSSFSQNINIYGDCSFEDSFYGSFYSSVYSPAGKGSGYCQENGTSRIYFDGGTIPVSGHCRQN